MSDHLSYDIAIAGGGLAGLALSIQLARKGYRVVLFEKESYPFHKVCGEYISLESWDFLTGLGVDLTAAGVPIITHLELSAPNGQRIRQRLPLGGFGMSRYNLDHTLASLATNAGVTLLTGTRVLDIQFENDRFTITTSDGIFSARVATGCYGKRSNLDIRWKRPFTSAAANKLNNYVGVKYHIQIDAPADTIFLHLFDHGYCGLVKLETGAYNLCYLTRAHHLQQNRNSIAEMERAVLSKNPWLSRLFASGAVQSSPLTISQISFDPKSQVANHVLLLGDAAGLITPLCGNGMSMALQASKLAAGSIALFLDGAIDRAQLESNYTRDWQKTFGKRLRAGRRIQRMFGRSRTSNLLVRVLRPFPWLINRIIRQTHGQPF